MTAMKSNQGWMVNLQLRDYQVKELLYRIGEAGTYQSTGHLAALNMKTGLPMVNPTISLPLSQPRSDVYVKLIDANDRAKGPFKLLFDPGHQVVAQAKQTLRVIGGNWVSFRDHDTRRLLYFTTLLTYRDAFREIRYSLDFPILDKRVPLNTPDPYTHAFVEVPLTTKSVYVQIVFIDSTETEVRQFKAP